MDLVDICVLPDFGWFWRVLRLVVVDCLRSLGVLICFSGRFGGFGLPAGLVLCGIGIIRI